MVAGQRGWPAWLGVRGFRKRLPCKPGQIRWDPPPSMQVGGLSLNMWIYLYFSREHRVWELEGCVILCFFSIPGDAKSKTLVQRNAVVCLKGSGGRKCDLGWARVLLRVMPSGSSLRPDTWECLLHPAVSFQLINQAQI